MLRFSFQSSCCRLTPALAWARHTDAADSGARHFTRRAMGLVIASAMFAQHVGLTLGGAGLGLNGVL